MDLEAFVSAAGLRIVLPLAPLDGQGGRILPPTYPGEGKQDPMHVVETYREDGQELQRVLVDSVASQANRHEAALVEARRAGRIAFPDLKIDFQDCQTPLNELLVSELPHRLADAIIRDSELDGKPFGESTLGKTILSAHMQDLSPILETSPTTLLFGAWFSQWAKASRLKLQRIAVSEIWAYDAVLGHRVGSRIDPLGILKVPVYQTGTGEWTVDEEDAKLTVKKPKVLRPSEINHGNIAPSIDEGIGITASHYELRWSLSTAALRRLSFGSKERTSAAQQYLIALALVSRALSDEAGYALRSRCDLVRSGAHTLEHLTTGIGGITSSEAELTSEAAIAALEQATQNARDAGFKLESEIGPSRTLKPGAKLQKLIAASAAAEAAGAGDEEQIEA